MSVFIIVLKSILNTLIEDKGRRTGKTYGERNAEENLKKFLLFLCHQQMQQYSQLLIAAIHTAEEITQARDHSHGNVYCLRFLALDIYKLYTAVNREKGKIDRLPNDDVSAACMFLRGIQCVIPNLKVSRLLDLHLAFLNGDF